MNKRITILALALLLAGAGLTLMADSPADGGPAADKTVRTDADRDALLAKLSEMKGAERRAFLKELAPEQRRGLWIEARRLQAEKNGAKAPNKGGAGTYGASPMTIDEAPGAGWLAGGPVGTIAYDSGFPTIGFGGGSLVGNRFDTHTANPVLASGTISTIQAQVVPGPANTTSSAGFVALGPQTGGGGAMAVGSTFTAATGVIDSVNFAGLGYSYTGSSFFVLFGDFASVYIPVLGTGTVNGQGHHGVVGYTGGMVPDITGTFDFGGSLNSFIRATGNILPVELMSFQVD